MSPGFMKQTETDRSNLTTIRRRSVDSSELNGTIDEINNSSNPKINVNTIAQRYAERAGRATRNSIVCFTNNIKAAVKKDTTVEDLTQREMTELLMKDPKLWREFAKEVAAANVVTNVGINEILTNFIATHKDEIKELFDSDDVSLASNTDKSMYSASCQSTYRESELSRSPVSSVVEWARECIKSRVCNIQERRQRREQQMERDNCDDSIGHVNKTEFYCEIPKKVLVNNSVCGSFSSVESSHSTSVSPCTIQNDGWGTVAPSIQPPTTLSLKCQFENAKRASLNNDVQISNSQSTSNFSLTRRKTPQNISLSKHSQSTNDVFEATKTISSSRLLNMVASRVYSGKNLITSWEGNKSREFTVRNNSNRGMGRKTSSQKLFEVATQAAYNLCTKNETFELKRTTADYDEQNDVCNTSSGMVWKPSSQNLFQVKETMHSICSKNDAFELKRPATNTDDKQIDLYNKSSCMGR